MCTRCCRNARAASCGRDDEPARAGHASGQRGAVHPARARVVPPVGLVAEVEVLLVVDRAAVEERAVEVLERGLGGLVGQGDRQLVTGGPLVDGRDLQRDFLDLPGGPLLDRLGAGHRARFAQNAKLPRR